MGQVTPPRDRLRMPVKNMYDVTTAPDDTGAAPASPVPTVGAGRVLAQRVLDPPHFVGASDAREGTDPGGLVTWALRRARAAVLAVSGGRDSMALLHAAAHGAPECVAMVATFDHGTGPAATAGAALVGQYAERHRLPCRVGRGSIDGPRTEAAWRAARWDFLRRTAAACGAPVIVTAHTRDDQVETVVIRVLRHAGARGLAGLDVDGDVLRPWLHVPRAAVALYAARHRVPHVEDPSNVSRGFLRNRVRLDLLPALSAARPGLEEALLACASAAASWRRTVEQLVERDHPVTVGLDGVSVAAHGLERYDRPSLVVIWPALAARAGITLDRRGTARLAAFTQEARIGAVTQVSGGFEVQRSSFSYVMRRPGTRPVRLGAASPGSAALPAGSLVHWVPLDRRP